MKGALIRGWSTLDAAQLDSDIYDVIVLGKEPTPEQAQRQAEAMEYPGPYPPTSKP